MIDITGVDLIKFVQKVYELSVPQGLGFLHFQPGGLSTEDAKCYINETGPDAVNMDYVHGRACKMFARREKDGKIVIGNSWYDHRDDQLEQLLAAFHLVRLFGYEHSCACNCTDCQKKRKDNT
jgi:hypothetical protein